MFDVRQEGEKAWEVRESTGQGYNRRVHKTRYLYAKTRKEAKERYVLAGYRMYEKSQLTASVMGTS
jgi:hypothetical protein